MSSKITLKTSHIYLDKDLIAPIFGEIQYAYVTYVAKQDTILITPVSSQWFIKLYKPTQFLLKSRNLEGDKTLAIREILIDNDLEMIDRDLNYEIVRKTNLIKVHMV